MLRHVFDGTMQIFAGVSPRPVKESQDDEVARLNRKNAQLRKNYDELSSEKTNLENTVDDFKQENARLCKNYEQLYSEKTALKRIVDDQKAEIKKLSVQAQAFEEIRLSLEKDKVKLKSIITSGARERDEPLDNDIYLAFVELRSLIQKLVHAYLTMDGPIQVKALNCSNREFFTEIWEKSNPGTRQRLLCGRIWETVYACVLSKPYFGYGGDVGKCLAGLEHHFRAKFSGDLVDEMAEWRRRTVKCISMLPEQSKLQSELAVTVGDMIIEFIQPVCPPESDASRRKKVESTITSLCEKAYALMLTMRKSKSTFKVRPIKPGVEIQSREGSDYMIDSFVDGKQPEHITGSVVSYTLFGKLTKVDYIYRKETVLEKAHVVCDGPQDEPR